MKARLAKCLRLLAYFLDGKQYVVETWHRLNVDLMNKYIGDTERYILSLEKALGPERVCELRKRHPGRFDTQKLHDAGAWN